jgi:hypothetical protein
MKLPVVQFDKTLRAIIRLKLTGPAKASFLNLEIDTGSQPELIISAAWAQHLGLALEPNHDVTLANGETIKASLGQIEVQWFEQPDKPGEPVRVDVIVFPDSPQFSLPSRPKHANLTDGLLAAVC